MELRISITVVHGLAIRGYSNIRYLTLGTSASNDRQTVSAPKGTHRRDVVGGLGGATEEAHYPTLWTRGVVIDDHHLSPRLIRLLQASGKYLRRRELVSS